jgi:hypothetical protein
MQFGAVGLVEQSGNAATDQQGVLPGVPRGLVQLNTAPERKLYMYEQP